MPKPVPLCFELHLATREKLIAVEKKFEANFTWISEVLECARATFNSPEIQLLPKTPSVKRTRHMRKGESDSDELDAATKRPRRGRPAKNETGSATISAPSTRSTRATRATRANPVSEEPNATLFPENKSSSTEQSGASVKPPRVPRKASNALLTQVREVPSPKPRTPAKAASPACPEPPRPKPSPAVVGLNIQKASPVVEEPRSQLLEQGKTISTEESDNSIKLSSTRNAPNVVKGVSEGLSPKPRTRSRAADPASPARPEKPCLKPIPGFTGLNVKAKATAYEEYVSSPQSSVSTRSSVENQSPRQRNALCRVLDSLRKSNSPRRSPVKLSKGTPPQEVVPKTIRGLQDEVTKTIRGHPEAVTNSMLGTQDNVRKTIGTTHEDAAKTILGAQEDGAKTIRGPQEDAAKTMLGPLAVSPNEGAATTCNREEPAPEKKSHRPARRSRRSSVRVVSKPLAVRTSISKRKKSLNIQRSSAIRHTPSKVRKPTPAPITLGDGIVEDTCTDGPCPENTSLKPPSNTRAMNVDTSDEMAEVTSAATPVKKRKSTRKGRSVPGPPDPECDADGDDEDDTPAEALAPVPVPRTTRSKVRLNKAAPPKLPVGSSEDENVPDKTESDTTTAAPTRTTRSKMRLNKPAPTKLGSVSSEDEPVRSTRSKMRNHEGTTDSPSLKRTQQPESDSPSKKKCVEGVAKDSSTGDDSDRAAYKTPSPPCPRSKVIRGQASLQTASFLSQLKKTVNTPSNLSTTVTSFIKRNTPIKSTMQDREQQKRREVEAKTKETEQRLWKRQELLQQRAEDQRRRREDRQAQAAHRREQNQKRAIESREEIEQQNKEKKDLKARMQEEKQREEREKQKMKEKKLAVAESKRKQEEEIRLQKLRDTENEAKQQQEMQQRKRELEEAERQKRQAEQRRVEEERRAEGIRERQREMERIHREAQEKTRQGAEKREQREEELKRERQEREKRELDEKKERERQRMEELEKVREKERTRLQALAAEQAGEKEGKKKAHDATAKHNSILQENKSLMNVSNTSTNPNTSNALPVKSALNTTMTKQPNPDSYEMTPRKKLVKSNTPTNYNIDNIASDDSTDDEEKPRHQMPAWATGANLKAALISQHYHPPDLELLFPKVADPDLNLVFKRYKPRFNKRTSSACWDSPIMKP